MWFFRFSAFVSKRLEYLFIKLPFIYLASIYNLLSIIIFPNNSLHNMPIYYSFPAIDKQSQETFKRIASIPDIHTPFFISPLIIRINYVSQNKISLFYLKWPVVSIP